MRIFFIQTPRAYRYTQVHEKFVIPARKRVSSAMDGELKYIRVVWIPAQICLEQICINPKGARQDSLT